MNLSGGHLQSLKMTTAQVVEASVTNDSLSKDYLHPDNHANQIIVQFVDRSVTKSSLSEDYSHHYDHTTPTTKHS